MASPQERGLRSPEQTNAPKCVDVIAYRGLLIPSLQEILAVQSQVAYMLVPRHKTIEELKEENSKCYERIRLLTREKVAPVWQEEFGLDYEEKEKMFVGAKGVKIKGGKLVGWNILSESKQPVVDESILVGVGHALDSSVTLDKQDREHTYFARAIRAYEANNQRELQKNLVGFSKVLKEKGRLFVEINKAPEEYQEQFGDNAAIAYKADSYLRTYHERCTIGIDINNSVILSGSPGRAVLGGRVRNSIIAGRRVFDLGASVHVQNSYFIDEKGVRYIEDRVVGHPELAKITSLPQSLLK